MAGQICLNDAQLFLLNPCQSLRSFGEQDKNHTSNDVHAPGQPEPLPDNHFTEKENQMANPILDAIKTAIAKYIETKGLDGLIALLISLISKKPTDEQVFSSGDPELQEIVEMCHQAADESGS